MHLMTAAGASAPADAVFRFTAGEAMQTSRPISASGEDDDEDTGSEESSDDSSGRPTSWLHPYLTPSAPPSSDPPG